MNANALIYSMLNHDFLDLSKIECQLHVSREKYHALPSPIILYFVSFQLAGSRCFFTPNRHLLLQQSVLFYRHWTVHSSARVPLLEVEVLFPAAAFSACPNIRRYLELLAKMRLAKHLKAIESMLVKLSPVSIHTKTQGVSRRPTHRPYCGGRMRIKMRATWVSMTVGTKSAQHTTTCTLSRLMEVLLHCCRSDSGS